MSEHVRELIAKAIGEVESLCLGPNDSDENGICGHDWRMSIPANRECDSDLIISDALHAANQRIAELEGRLGMAIVYEIPFGEKGRFVIRRCSCHRCYGKEDGGWTLMHDTQPAFIIPNAPSISIMTVMREDGTFGCCGDNDAHFPTADAAFTALAKWREKGAGE